jgi:hypothetical protein
VPALTAISMYFGTGRRRFKIRRMPEWVEAIFERGRVERSIIVCGVDAGGWFHDGSKVP